MSAIAAPRDRWQRATLGVSLACRALPDRLRAGPDLVGRRGCRGRSSERLAIPGASIRPTRLGLPPFVGTSFQPGARARDAATACGATDHAHRRTNRSASTSCSWPSIRAAARSM